MAAKDNETDSLFEDIGRRSGKARRALAKLLDSASGKEGAVFALRSEMGFALADTKNQAAVSSFTVVRDLNWIGKNVGMMGSGMPFLLQQAGESISESVKHRAPDYTRQRAISAYLARDKRRKFGPLLAVIAPAWINDPQHANWGFDGRAIKSAYTFDELDSRGQVGLLDLNGVQLYALDGQHRVMGIQGLRELQELGSLQKRERDGERVKEPPSGEDPMERFEIDKKELGKLLEESISIELIPAILEGETAREGAQRLRSVFNTINATSRRTGQGETTANDETDGFSIVGRKAATLHKLFANDRVNLKTATLPRRSKWYTTLEALKDMAREYLVQVKPHLKERWNPEYPRNPEFPIHPEEEEIEEGRKSFFEFLDHMESLPIFSHLENQQDRDESNGKSEDARSTTIDRERLFPGFNPERPGDGHGHLLMRPTGQVILAKAVGRLVSQGETLRDIFEKLAAHDMKSGFSQHLPENLWYGVTYDVSEKKMKTRVPDWAPDLLVHVVSKTSKKKQDELRQLVIENRREDLAGRNYKLPPPPA